MVINGQPNWPKRGKPLKRFPPIPSAPDTWLKRGVNESAQIGSHILLSRNGWKTGEAKNSSRAHQGCSKPFGLAR